MSSARTLLTACVATAAIWATASPALGAADPIGVFTPVPDPKSIIPEPPPTGRLNGPCGIAVDSSGRFYVSDYYHHTIDVFSSSINFAEPWKTYEKMQVPNVDPLDGPCGLAINSSNQLYVNNFHRSVVKYNAAPGFGSGAALALPSEDTAHHLPTGVAVNMANEQVYVNHRTYVSVFDSVGNPIEESGEPVLIGEGDLGDAYGVAVSQFPGTLGYVYVPDASTNTVKVFNPAASKTTPIATIKAPGNKPFSSLEDSAIAVDRVTGQVYFVDNTQPLMTEKPQASIYAFTSTNVYGGRLKYNVTDALPVGLAIDNSALATQGRVYVTSGYTETASVYVYGPNSTIFTTPLPPITAVVVTSAGSGSGGVTNSLNGSECSGTCRAEALSGKDVTLTASPDSGSEFAGWSGNACAGEGQTCTVTLEGEDLRVRAEFRVESPSGDSTPPAAASPPPASAAGPSSAPHRPRVAARKKCAKKRKSCKRGSKKSRSLR